MTLPAANQQTVTETGPPSALSNRTDDPSHESSSNNDEEISSLDDFKMVYNSCIEDNEPTPHELTARSKRWHSSLNGDQVKTLIIGVMKKEDCPLEQKERDGEIRLRTIQVHVLLRLQLLLLQDQIFTEHYVKLALDKSSKKRRKKKARDGIVQSSSPTEFLLDDIGQILSTAAFVLPQHVPFGSFLSSCLTKQVYSQLGSVVSDLFGLFEIPNPYVQRPSEDDDANGLIRPITRRKKKRKQQAIVVPPPPSKRFLPPKNQNRFGATTNHSHFHTQLETISKLLDQPSPPLRESTNANHVRGNSSNLHQNMAKKTSQSMITHGQLRSSRPWAIPVSSNSTKAMSSRFVHPLCPIDQPKNMAKPPSNRPLLDLQRSDSQASRYYKSVP